MTATNGNGQATDFITVGAGDEARQIAIALQPEAAGNGLAHFVWLGGYRSDMSGTKALEMDALAAEKGLAAIRFDYSGHGASGGAFRQGTISRWLEEALAVVDHACLPSLVLVGSWARGDRYVNSVFESIVWMAGIADSTARLPPGD